MLRLPSRAFGLSVRLSEAARLRGTVRFYNGRKGYGIITTENDGEFPVFGKSFRLKLSVFL